jgi:hypothetical protein
LRREALVAAQIELTDFRIFWDTLGRALAGRELILLDTDQITGRRNLFLFDPDQFRVPVPYVLPPERSLPPRAPFPRREEEP